MLHFIPRLFCLVIFSGYDTKCAVYENTSIFDCTQEFLVTNPKQWILSWFLMSVLSSIFFCYICGAYKHVQIRKLCCNVNFWGMMTLYFTTFTSFLVPVYNTRSEDMPLFCTMLAWFTSIFSQVIYLNNLAPITYSYDELQCSFCNENL